MRLVLGKLRNIGLIWSVRLSEQKICFSPPTDQFPLCRYGLKGITKNDLPIRGFYQMKVKLLLFHWPFEEVSATVVKFLVQVKLGEKFNNSFQYCELELPFPNRGSIVNMEASPSSGAVMVTPLKNCLKWNIGSGLRIWSGLQGNGSVQGIWK